MSGSFSDPMRAGPLGFDEVEEEPEAADDVTLDLEGTLNEAQREAVLHSQGPLLVFAGAGSGKTRVITYRIANLIGTHEVPAWRILAVTFTNKAAAEMRERVWDLLGERARGTWISTFHSFALRLLRKHGGRVGLKEDFTIYDTTDTMQLLKRVIEAHARYDKVDARTLRTRIDQLKNRGQEPDDFIPGDWMGDVVARVYPRYQAALRKANAVDFSDMLMLSVKLLKEHMEVRQEYQRKFRWILVDEFQDTNKVQYDLLRLLVSAPYNVTVVGDDDQSIYGWRGAELGNILGFPKHFDGAKVVLLEENYRSSGNILEAAAAVVKKNRTRQPKELFTSRDEGPLLTWLELRDEWDEGRAAVDALQALIAREGYQLGDCAFFVRVGAQTRVLEEALRAASIPHKIVGAMRFYERAEIKDALAYLRVIANPADDVNLERIINRPTRGIGRTSMEAVKAVAALRGLTLWEAVLEVVGGAGAVKKTPRKRLSEFVSFMVGARAAAGELSPADLLVKTLQASGYLKSLEKDGSVEAEGRLENLQELVGAIRDFEASPGAAAAAEDGRVPSLQEYLEAIALQSDQDEIEGVDRLPVLTVHSSKGLEFDAVFLIGMEDGIFPHKRSLDDPAQLEEERRLAYVAITRARHYLFFTTARFRTLAGNAGANLPSRYLGDIPAELIHRPLASQGLEPANPDRFQVETDDDDEPWLDRTDTHVDDDDVGPGTRVRHARFGAGAVQVIRGDRVTVEFEDGQVKTILGTHLELV